MNTGDSNTGFANSGNVGTGAFMTGNYSNGLLWRGNYEGLFSLHYDLVVPKVPILDAHFTGGFGPVVIPPIPVPSVNMHLSGNAAMGSFTIPQIDIPEIHPNIVGSVNLGPITLAPGSIPGVDPVTATIDIGPSTTIGQMRLSPFIIWSSAPNPPTWYAFGRTYSALDLFPTGDIVLGDGGTTGPIHAVITGATQAFGLPTISVGQIPIGFTVPGGVDAITIFPGGLTFDGASLLNLNVTGGTPGATIPAINWPEIPASADGSLYVIPSNIPLIDIPATPGFGNTTTLPSSGFFNTGAGGGSGFVNFGAGMSGWWNQAHSALAGAGSGIANVGALNSGVLNWGSAVSGVYNTSGLSVATPAFVSGFGNVGQQLSGLLSGGSAVNPTNIVNFGLANVGSANIGLGNIGDFNFGNANLGGHNLGWGNIGDNNLGFANIGAGNLGWANSGLAAGLPGIGNVGLGNAGSDNMGLANAGAGNVGLANSGTGNIGIGLVGNNLTGIGGLNSGVGNVGLFNSGTGNIGLFNTGTGNFGLFNSGSYNTGIGNSGVASTGLFNAGDFSTGLANAGSYNTGSFNVGDINTGDFNPGSINTGWFNSGDSNTGILNAGNVNTGALITGNNSNGILWRGDHEGLVGLSLGYTIPLFPAVGADVTGGVGPITVLPSIHIPSIPLFLDTLGDIGPVTIPDIPIPTIRLGLGPTVNLGPFTVDPITLAFPGVSIGGQLSNIHMTSPATPSWVFRPSFSFVAFTIDGANASSSTLNGFTVAPFGFDNTTLTIPGFTMPLSGPLQVTLPLEVTIPGFTIPGGTLIPQVPLDFGLSAGTPAFDLPPVVIGRIPLELHAGSTIGPIDISILNIPATPGFGNSTTVPSSGFFNTGGGGGSGYGNFGSAMSGWFNAISDSALGSASGFANFGTQLSGLLNRGAGISGVYNRSTLDLITSAFISGFDNVGEQLSGLLFTGTGP
ncbi:PPE family protein [third part] [Mycobacterium basiliense]